MCGKISLGGQPGYTNLAPISREPKVNVQNVVGPIQYNVVGEQFINFFPTDVPR